MTVPEIMEFLASHGDEGIKKILSKHGVKEPFFGVKIEYLKIIQKKVKVDYQLAKDLYATGNADAQYLAGLIADDAKMSKDDLQTWAEQALSNNIAEYTVPWVAAGSPVGYQVAKEWINDAREHIAVAGWCTLRDWVTMKPDAELNLGELKGLLARVSKEIGSAGINVKRAMNNFVAAAGTYVVPLTDEAMHLPGASAATAIQKLKDRGKLGVKKKMVKC